MMYRADEERYELMDYRRCGRSGLLLPLISLGLWHNFGEKADLSTMKKMIFTAFDNGITHFDLANNYGPGPGSAEINFGKILKEEMSSYRDEMIISTKAGYLMWPGPYGDMGSRKYLIASIDQSLKRLDLEYVDIFYHHRMDPDTPLEETMGALEQIVRSGKALYAGLSNYDGPTLERAVKILENRNVPFVIAQNCYNILNRTVEENGLKDAVKKNGKGLICYSPLAQGMLTDRYLNGIPSDSRVRTDGRFLKEEQVSGKNLERIRELNSIAHQRGQTLAEMALAWLLSDDAVTSVIVGASRPEQIETNLKAIRNITFSHDELERIDILSQ